MALVKSRKEIDTILFNALRAIFRFERQKVAAFGLTFEAIYLLQFLRRRPTVRVSEIAAEMQTPISTLSRTIGRLQKRGLVSRVQDAGDKRIMRVSLLPEGKKVVKAVETDSYQRILKNLETFSEEEIRAFIFAAESLGNILKIERREK